MFKFIYATCELATCVFKSRRENNSYIREQTFFMVTNITKEILTGNRTMNLITIFATPKNRNGMKTSTKRTYLRRINWQKSGLSFQIKLMQPRWIPLVYVKYKLKHILKISDNSWSSSVALLYLLFLRQMLFFFHFAASLSTVKSRSVYAALPIRKSFKYILCIIYRYTEHNCNLNITHTYAY